MNRKRDLQLISETYSGMSKVSIDLMTFMEIAVVAINKYGEGISDKDRALDKIDYMRGLQGVNSRAYTGLHDFRGHAASKMGVDGMQKLDNVRRILNSGSKVEPNFLSTIIRYLNPGGKALAAAAAQADPFLRKQIKNDTADITGIPMLGSDNKSDIADKTGIPKLG